MNLSSLTETELKEALMLKEKLDNYALQDKCQSRARLALGHTELREFFLPRHAHRSHRAPECRGCPQAAGVCLHAQKSGCRATQR